MSQMLNSQADHGSTNVEFADLISRISDQQEAGTSVDWEKLMTEHPEFAGQLQQVRPALEGLHQLRVDLNPITHPLKNKADSAPAAGQPLGDFQLLRELGRGGMGVVYEAQQLSIDRRVALKILPLAALIDDRGLRRFKNEVSAIATLNHPNIVSVFSVGEDRGVHYYAMELVRGQSLAAVIRELRAQASEQLPITDERLTRIVPLLQQRSDSGDQPTRAIDDDEQVSPAALETHARGRTRTAVSNADASYFRAVARMMIQVAEALQHAHELGVVHRDIKPGNLLLDKNGKIFVTDFGLARMETSAGVTMTGDILGTLQYMSPEQVLANRVAIDHRSDIYSLGATLYELLTLQPLWTSDNRGELVRLISFEEPERPRKLSPSIPVDLETIVLKAIRKHPQERYQAAQELADDLNSFLEHKPIQARPTTLFQHATKWVGRHKGIAATFVGVLLLAIIGLSISNWLIANERNKARDERSIAQEQKEEAERQKLRADENFRRAQEAVDKYLTKVSEEELLNAPSMQPLRKDLLELALEYYQEFIKELGDDQELRAELAAAYFRVGDITDLIGSKDKAIEAHQTALAIRQILVDEQSSRVEPKSELAESYSRLGQLQMEVGKNKEAQELHSRAIDISSMLVSSVPDNRDYRARLAWAHHQAAQLADAPADAKIEHASKAVAEFEKLTADHPDVPEYWHKLAWSYNTLGRHQATSAGRIAYFEKALGTQQKLVDEHSEVARYRHRLALYYYNRALFTEHRSNLRNDLINKSVSISERLVEENPSVVEYLNALARSYTLVFVNLTYRGDYDQALAIGQKEVEIRESLVKDNPNVNGYQFPLAMTLSRIAQLHELRDDVEDAVDCHRHAAQIFEQLATKNPELGHYLHNAGFGYLDSAKVFFRNRRYAETVDACRQALRCGKQLLDRNPEYPSVVHAESLVWLSRAQRKLQLVDEADASIDTVIQMMLDIPEDERQQRHWCTLGVAHYYRNRWADARRALETAIQKRGSFDLWDNRHWHLPMALHQMGETQKAREAYDDAVKNLKQFGVGERAMADKHRKEAAKVLGIETEEVLENGDRSN